MKEIIIVIKSQEEWDALDKVFNEPTRVVFQGAEIYSLDRAYENCQIELRGSSVVHNMHNSSVVHNMHNSSVIQYMYDSSVVQHMYDSSVVRNMYDSSVVHNIWDSSVVQYMYDSSVVRNMRNSSIVHNIWNASVVRNMYGSSVVHNMHDSSVVHNMRNSSVINNAFDSCVIFTDRSERVEFADKGVTIKSPSTQSDFETLLNRGVLRADGITKSFKRSKQISDDVKVYFLDDDTFCANSGEYFAHAKTLKMAVIDLRFKMGDRDKSEYEDLTLDSKLSFGDAVICYRVITGACSGGVEEFLESKNINKEELTIGEIIELTVGRYGHAEFKGFFKGEM